MSDTESRERPRSVLDVEAFGTPPGTITVKQQFTGPNPERIEGTLPLWMDRSGNVRIAINTHEPEWSGDYDQIIIPLAELLQAVGNAIAEQA